MGHSRPERYRRHACQHSRAALARVRASLSYRSPIGLIFDFMYNLAPWTHVSYAVPVTEAEIAAMGRGEWAQLYRRIGRHSPRASAENYFAATGMTPPVYGTPGALPSGGSPYGAHYGLPPGKFFC